MRHPMDIHKNVTDEQMRLKAGEVVDYLRDDGSTTKHRVKYTGPYFAASGDWVVHLSGIAGYVALCRVTRAES